MKKKEPIKSIRERFIILRERISSRGGGVEIDLTPFGYPGEKMSVYQNYLGGGMLSAIQSNDTLHLKGNKVSDKDQKVLDNISTELKQYLHEKTNPEDQEWESATFEQLQQRAFNAY